MTKLSKYVHTVLDLKDYASYFCPMYGNFSHYIYKALYC